VEDGALKGGLFGAVSEYFAGRPHAPIIKGMGIPDRFVGQDTQKAQWAACGLDEESIYELLVGMMKNL
jgi:1-deoxy-D-xylulose-5-phosphate synthase